MVMNVKVINNFVSQEEAVALNTFTLNAIKGNKFSSGRASFNGNKHLVSRFNKELEFPEIALQIKNRVQKLLGLPEETTNTVWNKSGIVVNCSFDGAEIAPHRDVKQGDKSLLRCNILSSAAEKGGVLTVENEEFKLDALSMYLCLVSECTHSVSKIEGSSPRILWQFGFNVDKKDWESKINNI